MYYIGKGNVTTIETKGARVESALKEGDITKPLTVPDHIDKTKLKKGTAVVYVVFDDMTGAILALI